MKKEYDFSKGERGKFYRPKLKLNVPIYLDHDVYSFVEKVAKKKQEDLSSVVNKLIKNDMKIAEIIKK